MIAVPLPLLLLNGVVNQDRIIPFSFPRLLNGVGRKSIDRFKRAKVHNNTSHPVRSENIKPSFYLSPATL